MLRQKSKEGIMLRVSERWCFIFAHPLKIVHLPCYGIVGEQFGATVKEINIPSAKLLSVVAPYGSAYTFIVQPKVEGPMRITPFADLEQGIKYLKFLRSES